MRRRLPGPPEPSRRLWVRVPAKINLALEVLGRRPDGYHELLTIFQAVGLHDTIEIRLRTQPGVVLQVLPPGLDLGPAEANLAVRAARLLLDGSGWGAELRLRKRIPAGAGLGGGSADAAGTLLGLAHLLAGVGRPVPSLPPLAVGLGADVPFFLAGGTQLGRGVGERLQALPPWPAPAIVLVFPNVGVPTSSVFGAFRTGLTPPGPLARMGRLESASDFWRHDWADLRNDLEAPVSELVPGVSEALRALRGLGSGFVRMSGSGSAVFGVAGGVAEARAWASTFRARGFWARAVRPVGFGCRIRVSRGH